MEPPKELQEKHEVVIKTTKNEEIEPELPSDSVFVMIPTRNHDNSYEDQPSSTSHSDSLKGRYWVYLIIYGRL